MAAASTHETFLATLAGLGMGALSLYAIWFFWMLERLWHHYDAFAEKKLTGLVLRFFNMRDKGQEDKRVSQDRIYKAIMGLARARKKADVSSREDELKQLLAQAREHGTRPRQRVHRRIAVGTLVLLSMLALVLAVFSARAMIAKPIDAFSRMPLPDPGPTIAKIYNQWKAGAKGLLWSAGVMEAIVWFLRLKAGWEKGEDKADLVINDHFLSMLQ